MIHPSAIIDGDARIGNKVEIGPYSVIGPGVEIGDDCRIAAHVVINGPTRIGKRNTFHSFCSIGETCQDKKFVGDTVSRLEIGDDNTFREYCSINRGTPGGGGVTTVGNDNWVMAYCHIAHDCHVGNHTVFANNATLAGHVEIGDHVTLGGFTGVHQFCSIGAYSFTAIAAIVVRDVPPYLIVSGNHAKARGLNRIGLQRHGFSAEQMERIKKAYKTLYLKKLKKTEALQRLAELAEECERVREFADFVSKSERGIVS